MENFVNHLKEFETHQDYEAFVNSSAYTEPNVSFCIQEGDVHYNPLPEPEPSHEYVDLGLPSGTLWAKYNVGANSESEYGTYYRYGFGATEYQSDAAGQDTYDGNEIPLAASADTATQVMGGSWHMPTLAQINELINNTTYEFTAINGVSGGKFTANDGSGKYVFFPGGGSYYNGSASISDKPEGHYLTSEISTTSAATPYNLTFDEYDAYASSVRRNTGCNVRGVKG